MINLRLEDVYPTGEYRAPKKGELFISWSGDEVLFAVGIRHPATEKRIIVKERWPQKVCVEPYAEGPCNEEDYHLPSNPPEEKLLHDTEVARESLQVETEAREAALLVMTKMVLDETTSYRDRRLAAKIILGSG